MLCLETSTNVCSVCICCNGELIAIRETSDFKSHTEKITIFIEECLQEAALTMKQLSAVALASGPGSYTGLRIGASTAKGLCFGLDIPLIGINSLEALIQGVDAELGEDDLVIASIDARRAEVYAMIFDSNLKVLQPTTSIILDEPNIISINYPNHKLHCIGNGAQKCKDLLPQKVVVYSEQSSSKFLCKLAFGKWQSAEFNDIITFSPSYYKNPNITLTKKKPL